MHGLKGILLSIENNLPVWDDPPVEDNLPV